LDKQIQRGNCLQLKGTQALRGGRVEEGAV